MFLPLCVGPTTKSENLWLKLNSGQGLVSIDAVTFRAAFVNCRTEQVFLRTHLISSTVCVRHAGSEPEQCLCEIENLVLPNHFFLSSPYKQDAYSGVNSACRENRQELDIRLSIYSGRGKHA